MSIKKFRGHKRTFSFAAETIDGYHVSAKMKAVWKVQLEILEKLIEVCEKHHIQYSLAHGSMLGAIRHKGFIPWDDDIDVVMKRGEYEKFIKVAPTEFGDQFFVKNNHTQPGFYRNITQICKNGTTALIDVDLRYNFHQGISIDVFPLDNLPDDPEECKKFLAHITRVRGLYVFSFNKLKRAFQKVVGTKRLINHLDKYVQKYNKQETKQCAAIAFQPDATRFCNKWFKKGNFIKVPFMYLDATIFKDYDAALRVNYGDTYMTPPEKKGNGAGSNHGFVLFDTKKDYSYYMARREEVMEKYFHEKL